MHSGFLAAQIGLFFLREFSASGIKKPKLLVPRLRALLLCPCASALLWFLFSFDILLECYQALKDKLFVIVIVGSTFEKLSLTACVARAFVTHEGIG